MIDTQVIYIRIIGTTSWMRFSSYQEVAVYVFNKRSLVAPAAWEFRGDI